MQVNGVLLNSETGSSAKRPFTQQIPKQLGQSRHMLSNILSSPQKSYFFYSYQGTNKSNKMASPMEINIGTNLSANLFILAKKPAYSFIDNVSLGCDCPLPVLAACHWRASGLSFPTST